MKHAKKNDCSGKIHKINLDLFKIVVNKQDYQDLILKIRKDFSIPLNGFEHQEKVKQWWYKLSIVSEISKIKFS